MTLPQELKIRALVVGINQYTASENLKYAINDATSVHNALRAIHEESSIVLMTDSAKSDLQPIRTNLLANIELISDIVKSNENILFYFAGHGKDVEGEPVLLPSDYRDDVGLNAAIKLEDIKNSFEASQAKFKLMIIDSCHSGAVKGREETGRMSQTTFDVLNEVPEGFSIFSACRRNQISFEDDDLKHGVFTHYLLEGFQGKADGNADNVVTVNELYDYVTPKVKDWVYEKHRTSQAPHMRSNFSGVYVVSRLPEKVPKPGATFGTELFSSIYLEQETYEMEWMRYESTDIDSEIKENIEGSIEQILLTLRREYGMSGLKDEGDTIYFNDGKIYRNIETEEDRNLASFSVGIIFNYNKDIWRRIDNLILELDDMRDTWVKIDFITQAQFDYSKIEKLCDEKEYEVVGIGLRDPKYIKFETDFLSDDSTEITVRKFTDYSEVSARPCGSEFLGEHFYALINPKKVSELLADCVFG